MGSFSVWHWIIVLVVIGVPAWLIIQSIRNRRTSAQLSGIGGWLALLAFGLCMGLLRNAVDLVTGLPEISEGWHVNRAARIPLAIVLGFTLVQMTANIWVITELFRKKRAFQRAYLVLWILTAAASLSILVMLTVPGVSLAMILPPEEIGRSIAVVCAMGLWFWYVSVSVRVRNTMVN
jgi:hypothetical protein